MPGAPTPTAPANTTGVAYVPDGGYAPGFQGVQVVHFETLGGDLLAGPQPVNIRFAGSVGVLGFTVDSTDVVAALSLTGGAPYHLAQDVFGGSTSSLVPVGAPYDMALVPTAAPTTGPTASPSPTPLIPPVVPDAYSIAMLGSGLTGEALVTGAGAGGILGVTSLTNAPPGYGGFIPFVGGPISPPLYPRTNIVVASDTTYALVRGPLDLLVLTVSLSASGYHLQITQYSSALGYGSGASLRGDGAMAISQEDTGRALIAQVPSGTNGLALVTGLPKNITFTGSLALPSRPHAVAISPSGAYAAVGADAGVYIIAGIGSGTLSVNPPFAPSSTSGTANSPAYTACDGKTHYLQNITGVGFASNGRYLVLLGTSPGLTCPSGYNSSVVVIPFNQSNGSTPSPAPTPSPSPKPPQGVSPSPTASPIPTQFTQNGIVTQPSDSSLMIVR